MKAELSQKGVKLDERDFFQDVFTEGELAPLIGDRSAAEYFSFKSPSFRKMGLDKNQLSDDQLLKVMLEEPRLIRRPLILAGDDLVVGTDKKAMAELFG